MECDNLIGVVVLVDAVVYQITPKPIVIAPLDRFDFGSTLV